MLLEVERNAVYFGKISRSSFGGTIKKRRSDSILERMYSLHIFRHYSVRLNSIFTCVQPIMDLKLDHSRGPSFVKLYRNVITVLPFYNAGYTSLRFDNALDLQQSGQRSRMLLHAFVNGNVRVIVPILYAGLRPAPEDMRQSYRNFYNVTRSENDSNMATENAEVHGNVISDDIIDVESY